MVAAAMGGCSNDNDDTGGAKTANGKQITFVGPVAAPVWIDAKNAFEAEAAKHGMQAKWVAPSNVDIPGNIQAIESAITAGADGIATCALDPQAYAPALQRAKERKIPVILVDCDTKDTSMRTSFVGTIGKTFGAATAKRLVETAGPTGQVIVMQGNLDAQIQTDIHNGFKEELDKSPGWRIVAREQDNSDVAQATSKFEALFRTHPGATHVHCIEANCPGAAVTVINERKLSVKVIGIDDQPPTLDGIRSGVVAFSAAQPFAKMGRLAAQYLAQAFAGETPPSTTDTGIVFITRDNVDSYKNDPAYK
jgi:ABC-type sugar transport system substrate-binding protein